MTKNKPFKKIIDVATGEETIVDLTAEEIAEIEKADQIFAEEQAKIEAEKKAIADKKQAILDKLGLTVEEAAALLS